MNLIRLFGLISRLIIGVLVIMGIAGRIGRHLQHNLGRNGTIHRTGVKRRPAGDVIDVEGYVKKD